MRKDILSLTIKEAIRLAEMYEDDIYWDIWEIDLWSIPDDQYMEV